LYFEYEILLLLLLLLIIEVCGDVELFIFIKFSIAGSFCNLTFFNKMESELSLFNFIIVSFNDELFSLILSISGEI